MRLLLPVVLAVVCACGESERSAEATQTPTSRDDDRSTDDKQPGTSPDLESDKETPKDKSESGAPGGSPGSGPASDKEAPKDESGTETGTGSPDDDDPQPTGPPISREPYKHKSAGALLVIAPVKGKYKVSWDGFGTNTPIGQRVQLLPRDYDLSLNGGPAVKVRVKSGWLTRWTVGAMRVAAPVKAKYIVSKDGKNLWGSPYAKPTTESVALLPGTYGAELNGSKTTFRVVVGRITTVNAGALKIAAPVKAKYMVSKDGENFFGAHSWKPTSEVVALFPGIYRVNVNGSTTRIKLPGALPGERAFSITTLHIGALLVRGPPKISFSLRTNDGRDLRVANGSSDVPIALCFGSYRLSAFLGGKNREIVIGTLKGRTSIVSVAQIRGPGG